MKKTELIFGFILLPLDYLMLILASMSAYFLRFGDTFSEIRPVIYELPFKDFFLVSLIASLALIIIFAWNGLYSITGTRRIVTELRRIFVACSTGVLIVIILTFFDRELFSSRFIILADWMLSIVYVSLARYFIIQLERYLFTRGIGLHRIVVIGDGRTARFLKSTIRHNRSLGYVISEECETINGDILDKLSKILKIKSIDEIILAQPNLSSEEKNQLVEFCDVNNISFKYAADMFDSKVANIEIRPLAGVPIVEIKRTPLDGWGKIIKRVIDIIFSILWLIFTGWLMLIIALAIKLDSPGAVIYKNERVGYKGKKFKTLKFRSMRSDYCVGEEYGDVNKALEFEQQLIKEKSIKSGPVYKIKDDPRVTRVGAFIRRTSLDEFLQVFNVLKGEMSWIGPRPHQPREVEKYEKQHLSVLSVKPGISGLAQISGRSDLEFNDEMKLDTYYIENWSLGLDLYIMFKTPLVLFNKRKAL
ncbi:MAG: sugar transferase [Patescibacteria group bacterium]